MDIEIKKGICEFCENSFPECNATELILENDEITGCDGEYWQYD